MLINAVTTVATQSFDTVKMRVRSPKGGGEGRHREAIRGLHREAGVRGLWRGSSMRLGRLVFSGGIGVTIYGYVATVLLSKADYCWRNLLPVGRTMCCDTRQFFLGLGFPSPSIRVRAFSRGITDMVVPAVGTSSGKDRVSVNPAQI